MLSYVKLAIKSSDFKIHETWANITVAESGPE
jgi:hypothetical protein